MTGLITPAVHDEAALSRIEGIVRANLPAWGVPADAALSLLAVSENATFLARCGAHDIVLRAYRPGYHDTKEILSELDWIGALRAGGIVNTPAPLPCIDGRRIAEADGHGAPLRIAAFAFAPGREPEERDSDLPRWFFRLGAIHARLHAQARDWRRPAGFVRKVWDFDSMLGDRPLWGDFRAALGLDPRGRTLLERTAAVLRDRLAPMRGPEHFGLVHADLRLANLLVERDTLTLIDFDDCGFSWYLYDFAAAVSFIETSPTLPGLRAAWMAGYRTLAPLPADAEAQLDVLVMLRRMLLTAWVASHAETPTAQAMGAPYTDGTLALAEDFLTRSA